MHFPLLVAGDDIDLQLAPFSEDTEVGPHEVPLNDDETQAMSDRYGIPATALPLLVAKIQDYFGEEGLLRDGRLYHVSRDNPQRRFDWYRIGGAWDGFLQLRTPRRLRRFFGLFPAGTTRCATAARKCDIDQSFLLSHPPAAILFAGVWRQSPLSAGTEATNAWLAGFSAEFHRIPEDMMLTMVDIHS